MSMPRSVAAAEPTTWWTRYFTWLVVGLGALAAGVRLLAIYVMERTAPMGLGGDGFYYAISSRIFAEGNGFGSAAADGSVIADALHPPLWTAFLGSMSWLGAQTAEQMGLAAGGLGIVTVVLVALAGRQIWSALAGVVAGALVAVSPAFWTYERNLNAEAITFPLIAATILISYRYKERPTLGQCLLLAATLGLLALARSEQALLIPVVFVPLVLATPSVSLIRRVGRMALAGVVVLTLIAPWTIYNLARFQHPIILSAGAGNALLAGACDSPFSSERLGSYDPNCIYEKLLVWKNPTYRVDPSVKDAALRTEAIRYTRDHLDQLPVVVAAREGRSWGFFRPAQQVELHATNLGFDARVIWLQMILYWMLLPLAVAGAVLLRRRRIIRYPLLAFPAISVIMTAITFGDIRYRAPAEVPLILLAAVAVDALLARARVRS